MKHLVRAAFVVGLSFAFPAVAAETIPAMVSTAAEASHVFCDATGSASTRKAPCFLRSLYVTTGAAAGFLMTFNAVSAPADGVVTPIECIQVAATSTVALDLGQTNEPYATGLTAVFSTTGCFNKTGSATAYFKARVQ